MYSAISHEASTIPEAEVLWYGTSFLRHWIHTASIAIATAGTNTPYTEIAPTGAETPSIETACTGTDAPLAGTSLMAIVWLSVGVVSSGITVGGLLIVTSPCEEFC